MQEAINNPQITEQEREKLNADLIEAIRSGGTLEAVKDLIAKGANVHTVDSLNADLIKTIRFGGALKAVEDFIAKGVNVNATDCNGSTALHYASEKGSHQIVELLLNAGADVNVVDSLKRNSLHYAAKEGWLLIAKLLIMNGANVNVADHSGRTALHYTSERGSSQIVELLLNAGANVNTSDCYKLTPIVDAAKGHNLKLLKLLCDSGALQNISDTQRALYEATLLGRYALTDFLLNENDDPDVLNCGKYSPTHQAIYLERLDEVKLLLNAGANLNTHNSKGETPATLLELSTQPYIKWMTENFCATFASDSVGGCFMYSLPSMCTRSMASGLRSEGASILEVGQRDFILSSQRKDITIQILNKIYPLLQQIIQDEQLTPHQKAAIEHIAAALIASTHCKKEDMDSVMVTTDAIVGLLNEPEMAAAKNVVLTEIARSKRKIGPSINGGVAKIMNLRVDPIMERLTTSVNFENLKSELKNTCYYLLQHNKSFLTKIPKEVLSGHILCPRQLLEITIKRTIHSKPNQSFTVENKTKKLDALRKYSQMFNLLEGLGATMELSRALEIQDPAISASEIYVGLKERVRIKAEERTRADGHRAREIER